MDISKEIKDAQQKARDMITKGKIEECIDFLRKFIERHNLKLSSEILILSYRYTALRKSHITGILSDETYSVEINKIVSILLVIIQMLGKDKLTTLDKDKLTILSKRDIYYYAGIILKLSVKSIGMYIIAISLILFFLRRDIIIRLYQTGYNTPIEELFFPVFLLILGIFLYRYKIH